MDEQFEAFLQESISEEDSTKFKQIFCKTEAKPWWIEADEESDDDTGKGHNFLKSHPAGPTHSTPDDTKKKPAEDEYLNLSRAPKETSNKVEKLSSRYAKIGEISNYQRGIRKFEGTLSKDSLEDISEKSEEDSESKRFRMQKETLVSTETTSQMTVSLIQTNKQPQDELLHTGSLPLFKDNSHPGQDTLEEMMDKQKFFFDLEQNASGTLDYGLLNQQLSNTASVININAAAQGEHSPILNSANSKEPSEITPNQQKPSLLSKVSLKDSQGSSLNTTGISTQADVEHSPLVSKEHVKDTFEDTEFVLIQKDNSGTITSQEMEDLHIALQNIDMSSALSPNELPQRILKPAETVIKLQDKIEISENDDCAIIVADSCINKPTSHQLFKNSKAEIDARLNNQDDNSEMNKTNSRHIEYLEKEVEFWKNKYEEEKQQLLQLKSHTAAMGMKQKHDLNQQKQIYENEIDSLKKSNFVLKSKISKEQKEVSESEVGIRKELSEQQVLLLGYQTENERLYNEAKQLKTQYKVSEEKLFRENQKLLIKLNSLKSQLEFKENLCPPLMSQQPAMANNFSELFSKSSNGPPILCINCGHPSIFSVSKLSQLESERQVQDVYAIVKRENSILEKTKQELESQINLLIHQKEEMRQSLQEVKNGKLEEFNVIESKLKEERDEMKKKLHWYAYNQQLLDQDIAVFKQKDKEIERLNKKIEQLQSETGRRLEENKMHSKEKSVLQNRIQDLEKQVREMERIFQKRNPNSLTTLFLAASNLEKDKASNMKDSPSLVVKVLEEKVKKLESELELKENMEDKSIRSVEQKYNKLKFHYEEQIENLEQQLHHFQQKSSLADHPHTHRLALENELESVRERHRTETAELQVQLNQLHAAVDKLKKDEGSLQEEMKVAQEQEKRIKAQNQVLRKQFANSNQQVIMLRASVARLKQEKKLQQQQLHQRATSTKQDSNTLDLPQKNKFKKNNPSSTQKRFLENRDLAGTVKIHKEIIEENESLKTKLDHLQLTIEQQKVELYKNKAESEAAFWKIQKKHKTQIDMLKLSHQQELQQILTEQTLRNSTSQIPELLSKIDAQQILINHLKEQLVNTQVDGEKLSMLTIREVVLENQVKQLTDKLGEAKKTHSPDRIHFENLVNKMQDLEKKHVAREKELQNIIKNGRKLQVSELEKEVNKWKRIAESKNQDIENYRIELDSILNILQSFQQQGLIISGNISQHN